MPSAIGAYGGTYERTSIGWDTSNDFHTIWRNDYGYWVTIGWIGSESPIVPGNRRSVTPKQIEELLRIQDNECKSCRCDHFVGKISDCDVDHIIPLRLGGASTLSNLLILFVTCHRRKPGYESLKIRGNGVIDCEGIDLVPGEVYIACSDTIVKLVDVLIMKPKDIFYQSDGLYKLVY